MAKAAYALFMEYGYEKTTMRMIFDRAKCGAGSTYNEIERMENILLEVMVRSFESARDIIYKMMEPRTDMRGPHLISGMRCPVCFRP
ncbi:MAG: TetR/AcrR family transcriptional regulator [Candidatus Methanomethylophilaceae archaeon]